MSITCMHCKRLISPPRHVIDKYSIAMYLSNDVIMITFDALQMRREANLLVLFDENCIL